MIAPRRSIGAGAVPAMAAAIAMLVAAPARAQRLNLDPTPTAPALPSRNAATALGEVLAREVDALTGRARANPAGAWRIEASIAWRRTAHELLMRGADPESPRHELAESGFRLADARGDFDRALERIPPQGRVADRAREGLDRFAATPAALRASAPDELDETLDRSLASLDPLLEAAGMPRVRCPWPAPGSGGDEGSWSARIRTAARGAGLPTELAASLEKLAARIEAAEAWPDLAAELEPIAGPLEGAPAIAAAIAAASWVPPPRRDEWMHRLAAAVSATETPSQRDAALAELSLLEATAATLVATEPLVKPRAGAAPRGPIDPTRITKSLAVLAAPLEEPDRLAGRLERLEMLERLLATMAEVRTREEVEVRRTLRTLRRELSRDALRQEEPVLRQVESLAAPDAHPTDPACASLLESQRRRIRALAALDGVDRALTEIEGRMPASAKGLEHRWRAPLATLPDAARGEAALRGAEAFVRQWAQLRELPAESAIRRGEPEALELCAGRARELLGALDRRRDAWAAAWAEGDAAKAETTIAPIVELLAIVEDGAALARTRANPRLIGRWGGWDDLGGVPGATDAMDARVALAVEALARDDDAALREALRVQTKEAPLWRLRARLLRLLSPSLAELPDGLAGAIGRASKGPPADALLADRAADLLRLARFSREYLFAMAERESDRAESIHDYLRALARDLLLEVDRISASTGAAPGPKASPRRRRRGRRGPGTPG